MTIPKHVPYPISLPILALIALAALAGCDARERDAEVQTLQVPAGAGSLAPRLHVPEGRAPVLSWLEPAGDGHALRFARFVKGGFSAPLTVATGTDWFANWADTPSVIALADGRLVGHWLEKSGPGTYSYDIRLSISEDQGATWSKPATPHTDETKTEHGFARLFPDQDELGAVWLDGRKTAEKGPMTLRYGRMDERRRLVGARELDGRVCDCCMTAAAHTSAGLLVIYRDRSEDEIRDIYHVLRTDDGWTGPLPVHRDGWKIPGCPVNGPAVAADGDRVAVAWFTAAGNRPAVKLAFSRDGGRSFDEPIVVDDTTPAGRVDVTLDTAGRAWLSWLDGDTEPGRIRLTRFAPDGDVTKAMDVARVDTGRSTGFPVLGRVSEGLVLAWTDPEAGGVRAVLVSPAD